MVESEHCVEEVISNGSKVNKVNRNKSCKSFYKMAKGLYSITSLAYHGGVITYLSSTFKRSVQVKCHQLSRTNTNQLCKLQETIEYWNIINYHSFEP